MSLSKPCNFSFYPDSLDYYSIYTTIFIPCYHHFCHIIMVCLPPFIASCYPDSLDCSLYHPLYIYTYIYNVYVYIYISIPFYHHFLLPIQYQKSGHFPSIQGIQGIQGTRQRSGSTKTKSTCSAARSSCGGNGIKWGFRLL